LAGAGLDHGSRFGRPRRGALVRPRGRLGTTAEATGQALPASLVAGVPLFDRQGRPVLVIDEDATIVACHSEKESAAATFKHSFGFHPVLAFCDNSNEALAGMLRPGNAGSNTAADLIAVLDQALAQIPDEFRHGYPLLVRRLQSAAGTYPWAARCRRAHRVQRRLGGRRAGTHRDRGRAGDCLDGGDRHRRRPAREYGSRRADRLTGHDDVRRLPRKACASSSAANAHTPARNST
jgi:hypothetical protein